MESLGSELQPSLRPLRLDGDKWRKPKRVQLPDWPGPQILAVLIRCPHLTRSMEQSASTPRRLPTLGEASGHPSRAVVQVGVRRREWLRGPVCWLVYLSSQVFGRQPADVSAPTGICQTARYQARGGQVG